MYFIVPFRESWLKQREIDGVYRSFKNYLYHEIGPNWLDIFYSKISISHKIKKNDVSNFVKLLNTIENYSNVQRFI